MKALRSPEKGKLCVASEGDSNDLYLLLPQCSTDREGFAIFAVCVQGAAFSPGPSRENGLEGFRFYFVRNISPKGEKAA